MARCRPSGAPALVLLLVAATLTTLAPTATAAEATAEGTLPIHVVGASAVFYDGATFLLGGRIDDGTYSDAIYRYDHATGAVSEVGTLPSGRQSGTATVLGGRIYYFGGAEITSVDADGNGEPDAIPRAVDEILRWDPAAGGRATPLLAKLPAGAWGVMSTTVGSKAYVMGGFSFDFTRPDAIDRKDWLYEFDGTSLREVGVLPYAIQDAAVATIGSTVYVFGGLSDHEPSLNPCPTYRYYNPDTGEYEDKQPTACLTDNVLQYDPASGIVAPVADLPYRAQFLHAAVVGGKAYVAGGAIAGPTATTSILEFDPTRAEPIQLLTPTLPKGTYGSPATSDGSVITLFGGRTGGYSELTDSIVRFDPRPTAPWAPRSAEAATTRTSVALAWDPPVYDGGSPVTLYRVYRIDDAGEVQNVSEVAGGVLRFVDDAITPGASYTYRITSVNVAGESTRDARVTAKAEETVPGPVAAFDAFPGDRSVLLRWVPPENDGGLNLGGYRVYRNGTLIATVPPGVEQAATYEHLDQSADLRNGVEYAYTVLAYNAKGDGERSTEKKATPLPVPGAPLDPRARATPDGVRVSWSEPASGLYDDFVVLRGTEPGHLATVATLRSDILTYDDSDVQQGRTYYYAIRAKNSLGESVPSTLVSVSLVTPPSAPLNLLVAPGRGEIRLNWQTPDDLGGADPKNVVYQILRAEGDGELVAIATDVRGAQYNDRYVTPGTDYTYAVVALNPLAGERSPVKTTTAKLYENELPTADLVALPPIAKAGEEIELDASGSADLDGQVVKWRFDYGDGTAPVTTDEPTARHAYLTNGTYYATVTAIDERNGESPAASVQLIIGEIGGPLGDAGIGSGLVTDGQGNGQGRPGTGDTQGVPAPGLLALLTGLGLAAHVAHRRRRG